jgi:hypothetical protein
MFGAEKWIENLEYQMLAQSTKGYQKQKKGHACEYGMIVQNGENTSGYLEVS